MAQPTLGSCLDLALEARLDEGANALSVLMGESADPSRRAKLAAVAGFTAVIGPRRPLAHRYADAAVLAAREAGDAASLAYATAAASFIACVASPHDPEAAIASLSGSLAGLDEEDACVAGYLAIEAAMSAGRLVDAEHWALAYLAEERTGSRQAPTFATIALARALVFQGRVPEASVAVQEAIDLAEARGGIPARMLALSTAVYIAAQREDRVEAERLTTIVVGLEPNPMSYVTVGSHILCAYGLGAVGAVSRAAELVLHAGGGPSLPRLQTVDRAYAYELLATDAIEHDDLRSARAWGRRATPLQIHDMAAAAVERTLSRIDVATGRTESGAERAAVSAARALVAGGRLDAARSRVLQASALAATAGARGAAVAGFRTAADEAEVLGAVAVRNWSARELRRLGRRLRPASGSGWQALSEREQQIALLAAEGYSNRMIGKALFLSERTVQSHLSRALAALGASSRAALPASLGRSVVDPVQLDGLTLRQQQVAALVAEGCSNRTISMRLTISDKTVEKHVQAIFSRWHVSSRTAIANRVLRPLAITEGQSA